MDRIGWDALDVLLVVGDAYIDHPAFGVPLLGRLLAAHGYRVGIVSQPRWDTMDDVARLGRPKLFAGVSAGAIDSMLAHYTAFRKKRSDDAYTPGGLSGARPNRACIVYTNLLKQAFPGLPVVLGGIEASLRRISHYDFWSDGIRRSILLDSKADLLIYGMAERAVLETADRLRDAAEKGKGMRDGLFEGIPGTVVSVPVGSFPAGDETIVLPSHEEIVAEPFNLLKAALLLEDHVHRGTGPAVQRSGNRLLVVSPPGEPLSTEEMDALYELPFARRPHPSYAEPIPAHEMIRDSVTSHRGCGGGCSFCSLALHQGRRIQSRSAHSIRKEVERCTVLPDWSGSISDVGGPSGNMWGGRCTAESERCRRASCLFPRICPNFRTDQRAQVELLRSLQRIPGVKHVRLASGIRFDLALTDLDALADHLREFVGGQLKIAPEHVADPVLTLMRKPGKNEFERFLTIFERESRKAGKRQFVVPYLMSAFPGCTDRDMEQLAAWLGQRNWRPRQVQCFIPTPGTVATAMFHSRRDPDGRPILVAFTDAERIRQHRLLISVAGGGRGPVKPGSPSGKNANKPMKTRERPVNSAPPEPSPGRNKRPKKPSHRRETSP